MLLLGYPAIPGIAAGPLGPPAMRLGPGMPCGAGKPYAGGGPGTPREPGIPCGGGTPPAFPRSPIPSADRSGSSCINTINTIFISSPHS